MASAWPEPPSARFADARDGMEVFAFGGTDTALNLFQEANDATADYARKAL